MTKQQQSPKQQSARSKGIIPQWLAKFLTMRWLFGGIVAGFVLTLFVFLENDNSFPRVRLPSIQRKHEVRGVTLKDATNITVLYSNIDTAKATASHSPTFTPLAEAVVTPSVLVSPEITPSAKFLNRTQPTTSRAFEVKLLPLRLEDVVPFEPDVGGCISMLQPRNSSVLPRIYDAFLFNTEFVSLEIRLMTLYKIVDVFVLVEADFSLTGNPKPYYFEQHKHLLKDFLPKIFHVKLTRQNASVIEKDGQWKYERFARRTGLIQNGIMKAGIQSGDVILISDVDEIPKPQKLWLLKHCVGFEFPTCIASKLFYYSFDVLHNPLWHRPNVDVYTGPNYNRTGEQLRNAEDDCRCKQHKALEDGGWHCSWCFETVEEYQLKMASYAHTEHNKNEFRDPANIKKAVTAAEDLFHRSFVHNTPLDAPIAPPYVLNHPDRFDFMLHHKTKFKL